MPSGALLHVLCLAIAERPILRRHRNEVDEHILTSDAGIAGEPTGDRFIQIKLDVRGALRRLGRALCLIQLMLLSGFTTRAS